MENKEEFIKNTIKKFALVASKYCESEELPIKVSSEIVISTKEAHVIQAIGDNEKIGVTDLGNFFGISKSAASQMVSKLSSRGFIKKMRSEINNKEVDLVLTVLGEEAYNAHENSHKKGRDYLVSKMSTFSLSQIATLLVMLECVEEIMEERLEENKNRR